MREIKRRNEFKLNFTHKKIPPAFCDKGNNFS